MKKLTLLLLVACSKHHSAAEFAAMIPEKITGKCTQWSEDSVMCHMSDTTLLWCQAPRYGKPHCEVAVDWTPKPSQAQDAPTPASETIPVEEPSPKKKNAQK